MRRYRIKVCVMSFVLCAVAWSAGCTRTEYRRRADAEAYCLIGSRKSSYLWDVPSRAVEPAAHSRMYVAAEQDCGPKPPDDPSANCYSRYPNGIKNTKYYDRRGDRLNTENPAWVDHLPRDENDQIKLTQTLAVDLALLHSRDYQTQFESVYLNALELSGNRFEFDTQWFGGVGAGFSATGEDLGSDRFLDVTTSRLGFTRNLAGGGQFATSVLNSLAWNFGTNTISTGSASLVSTFTQPLLRGAFRHVRLESLTQSERNLLYSVRDFARFRRTFHVDVATSYLNLLTQVQAIRNLRTNLENLGQNLVEHEEYVELEMVSLIQRDQVFQEFQNGRLSLLSAEQDYAESLDQFKFEIGLPPWVPLEIDESFLEPFELVDPRLVKLQAETQELYQSLMQCLSPAVAPQAFLLDKFREYELLRERVAELSPSVNEELERWEFRIADVDKSKLDQVDVADVEQQEKLAAGIRKSFLETQATIGDRVRYNESLLEWMQAYDELPEGVELSATQRGVRPEILAWDALTEAVGGRLREEIAELYVAQTQVRLFLIDVEPQLNIDEKTAITYAHDNRLDLMNSKARVMDTYRRVEVAADALQSDLSVTGAVGLGSDSTVANAYRFDANNNTYTLGVEFDGPLNRLNERNSYRATQVVYQAEAREYMANKDRVANEIRSVFRQLELSRLSFQISRQQLVAATRQVDQAQIDLRRSLAADSNLTLFLLEALQGVLDAKNNLISNWVRYQTQKMRLYTALELLYLDEGAQWINEEDGLEQVIGYGMVDPEYFPPEWTASPVAVQTSLKELPRDNEMIALPELPEPSDLDTVPVEAPVPVPE